MTIFSTGTRENSRKLLPLREPNSHLRGELGTETPFGVQNVLLLIAIANIWGIQ